jgi:hypothetical protein
VRVADDRRDSLDEGLARMREAMNRAWRVPLEPEGGAGPEDWRGAWREQRRALKEHRRLLRRRRGGSRISGAIFLGAAAVMVSMVLNGAPFWLLWVAFGFCFPGFKQLFGSRGRDDVVDGEATSVPVPVPEPDPANLARVDALCDKLLEEIKKGPAVLREVVRRPEESVRGLRDAIHGLARREAEVRGLVTPADGERLQRERADLVSRRDGSADPVTRERWEGALAALDAQLQHREKLRTQAARLEAERVRLGYTLENLYTQVLAVRGSAASDEAGTQLKQSVEQLGDEISAVAGALESMQAVDPGPAAPEHDGPAQPSRERI